MFFRKGVLKICSKFTGEHPYRSVISIKLLRNFFEIAFWHGCSPVNLLHIFRTTFLKTHFWMAEKCSLVPIWVSSRRNSLPHLELVHLMKKPLMLYFIFCAMLFTLNLRAFKIYSNMILFH